MSFSSFLAFASAAVCCGLGILAVYGDRRSFAHVAFAAGMILLSLQEVITGLGALTRIPEEVLHWQYVRIAPAALGPGIWLVFSLTFGRVNYADYLRKWKWGIIAVFLFLIALPLGFREAFFISDPMLDESSSWFLRIGWSGLVFHVLSLIADVAILVNLEGTLRAFRGSLRWKVKFTIIGVGSLFAIHIYKASQIILFSGVSTGLDVVESGALFVAALLLMISFARSRIFDVDIYVSDKVIYSSLTAVAVGLYLVAVAVLSQAVEYFGGQRALALVAFIAFAGLLVLVLLLLADELRQKLKAFVARNFQRPRYDYRREWMRFTERTASILNANDLCVSIAGMVAETFGTGSVCIFLLDEAKRQLSLSGSTTFSAAEAKTIKLMSDGTAAFLQLMRDDPVVIDFERPPPVWGEEPANFRQNLPAEAQARYCAPLIGNGQLTGLMTVSRRITGEAFLQEDLELLKAVCDQTAANLLNLRLSEALVRAKEMEAFQAFSAFFVHDLKNLASTLSMTVRNLQAHFDDPEFRKDAVHAISQSVDRIKSVSQGISLVGKKLELRCTKVDLNQLIASVRAQLNGSFKTAVSLDLHPVPELSLDSEQIEKVLVNLLLNANEATSAEGQIHISTERRNGWLLVSVRDSGCGMSEEFMATSLFKPFRSSKKHGLGIGLFHSKKIVESHNGRIEVESEVGKGSTFRIMLPVG